MILPKTLMSLIRFVFSRIFLKQLLFMLLFLFAIVSALLFWLDSNTRHGEQIEVHDLSGMTLEEALRALEEHQLSHAILDTTSYNPNFAYQTVI